MKKIVFYLAAMILALAGPAAAKGSASTNAADKAEIERLDRLVSTTSSFEEGISVYAPDVVQNDFFPPERRGVGEVREDFKTT